jgi:hypothetical protein
VTSLVHALKKIEKAGSGSQTAAQLAQELQLKSQGVAEGLVSGRHYTCQSTANPAHFDFDPRFLVFEFTYNILLRKPQVQLVTSIMNKLKSGDPIVHQMIMGGGKTTVIGR